jgi:hypothetical protein
MYTPGAWAEQDSVFDAAAADDPGVTVMLVMSLEG